MKPMICTLIKIANDLDKKGFYEEANRVDAIIRVAVQEQEKVLVLLNEFLQYFGPLPKTLDGWVKLEMGSRMRSDEYGETTLPHHHF